ncbi:MAG TPA: GntR family transcriptional regulator [Candidatus Limnocylindria bacterium]|nr:GntR family transcriptional regulator [Candidatus Limnocylindria bacterium]
MVKANGSDGGRSLAGQAYDRLRRDILRCHIKPGQEVTEAQLAAQYRLGKTPVREGLARLVHEGLVHPLPRRGYRVAPITIGNVKELLGFRLIVETQAAKLAAGRCNVAQLRRLDELCAVGYDPNDAKSLERFLRANRELHTTIAAAAGNRKLAQVITQLLDEVERVLYMALELGGRRVPMSHAHRSVVDALAAGDGEAAAAAIEEQIRGVERMILEAAIESPRLSVVNLAAV